MFRSNPRPSPAARRHATRAAHACAFSLVALAVALPALAADPFLRRTATVDVVERVGPSVVNILAEDTADFVSTPIVPSEDALDQYFGSYSDPRAREGKSRGSGVIFDREGHVLTNMHVIRGVKGLRVALADGRIFPAEVVGADEVNDLAILRLRMEERETLPFTKPGDSNDLLVGEPVIAIGNPLGFSNSVTTGVISSVNRTVRREAEPDPTNFTQSAGLGYFHGLIQTDASINHGNSGGPLLNAEGRLIGINVAMVRGAQGLGLAIPIDTAKRVINELLLYDEVRPVWLGLEFQELDPRLQQILDMPRNARGALVSRVQAASPAALAGIERGDVIIGVDGRKLTGVAGQPYSAARQLNDDFNHLTDGRPVDFEFVRGSAILEARAIAAEMPPTVVSRIAHTRLGLELELAEREQAYAIRGVREGSSAEALGLRPGDFLLQVNGVVLRDYESLRRAIAKIRGKTRALVVVQRGPGLYPLAISLP
jgi:serine protease Do